MLFLAGKLFGRRVQSTRRRRGNDRALAFFDRLERETVRNLKPGTLEPKPQSPPRQIKWTVVGIGVASGAVRGGSKRDLMKLHAVYYRTPVFGGHHWKQGDGMAGSRRAKAHLGREPINGFS